MHSPLLSDLRGDNAFYPPAQADNGPVRTVGRPVSLRLSAGDRIVLRGPSGCGKSTLLKIAAGLHPHYEGCRRLPQSPLIGYMPQDPCLLPWRTVEQNMTGLARAAGRRPPAGAAADICRRLWLQGLEGRYPAALSGGQYRRVMLARTLLAGPGLLLLDEPFTGLDRVSRELAWDLLEDYLDRVPAALLLATHQPDTDIRTGTQTRSQVLFFGPADAQPEEEGKYHAET